MYRKLGRDSSARKALFRSMLTSFFQYERIETTEAKAKELRSLADQMVTLDTIAPKYADRQGGYTRVIKTGLRKGDAAPLAIIELV